MPAQCAFEGRYEFAAAHSMCAVGISARVLLVVPVPVPVPVVLLIPLVCDSTNRAENTSPIYTGTSKIYVGHEPRNHEPRTVDFPFNIKDGSVLSSFVLTEGGNSGLCRDYGACSFVFCALIKSQGPVSSEK